MAFAAPSLALAQQTTLRVDLASPAGTAGAKQGDDVPWDIELAEPATAPIPLRMDIVLVSMIDGCVPNPAACSGGENFFDDVNFVYGCADMADNDSNGLSDAADPDCQGVQGWSMSIRTDVCFNIRPTTTGAPAERGATTFGTVGALNTAPPGLRDPAGSFEKTEAIDPANNAGQEGAVTAVVLAFVNPVILPQLGEETVLKLNGDFDASALQNPGDASPPCRVEIVSPEEAGLRGSGEPVQTASTVAGETDAPARCHAAVTFRIAGGVKPPESQTALRLDVTPQGGQVVTSDPEAGGIVPWTISVNQAAMVPVKVNVVLESRLEACLPPNPPCTGGENFFDDVNFVYGCADTIDNNSNGLTDAADPDCVGVQGWSMSIDTEPCFNIRSTATGAPAERGATTIGTVGALNTAPPGLRDPAGSFEKTEAIDPARNNGNEGAVSAVVLAFTNPVILPQTGDETVLFVNGDIDAAGLSPGGMTAPCALSIISPELEGYRGSGEPVQTAVTVGGETDFPSLLGATVKVLLAGAPPTEVDFIRGDPNDDGRSNIADPIWIISMLFRQGPMTLCSDSADANDDDLVDQSDAMWLIQYQFNGGPTPRPPFPACGQDADTGGPDCTGPVDACPA
jgi:hypothetical protein